MALFSNLIGYPELNNIFESRATLQGMLDFEAALARAEAACGVIPKTAAGPIGLCCKADLYDVARITTEAAGAGNIAIPLVKQLTGKVDGIDAVSARYVHWGTTSQDVMDTGLVLQLRQALKSIERDLAALAGSLKRSAAAHRATPIAARTWLQQASPTTLGLKFAGWLDAIQRHRTRFGEMKSRVLVLQFGGAAGTLAALGDKGMQVANALAAELDLAMPDLPWHTERDRVAEVAVQCGLLAGTLGKIGRDLALMAQSEVAEVAEPSVGGRGGSSTLPHKRNSVTSSVLLATATRVPGLVSTMLAAMVQEHERALGGWQAEWETLPQIVTLTGGALHQLAAVLGDLEILTDRMRVNLEATQGLIFAERAAMLLAPRLGKAAAHEILEAASHRAIAEKRHLRDVLAEDARVRGQFPNDEIAKLFDPMTYLGMADEFISRVIDAAKE